MGKLGWSYPAGCAGPPAGDDPRCAICGLEAGSCICPECSLCHEVGNPRCYQEHGLSYQSKKARALSLESEHEIQAQ